MANGSRRTTPTWPTMAAVVSDAMVEAAYTPCVQSKDSVTSGTAVARRPPNRNTLIGTPAGFSQSGSTDGIWLQLMVKRALGCAALRPQPGVQALPCQSVSSFGASFVMPSHHTSPSGVSATLVNIVSCLTASRQLGLVNCDVPGATPNAPASGLMA